jgi:hypothetical protein
MAAARSRSSYDAPPAKPRSDAYTGLLILSLLAQVAGAVFLYLDWKDYPDNKPKQVSVPSVAPAPAPAGAPAGAPPGGPAQQGVPPAGMGAAAGMPGMGGMAGAAGMGGARPPAGMEGQPKQP